MRSLVVCLVLVANPYVIAQERFDPEQLNNQVVQIESLLAEEIERNIVKEEDSLREELAEVSQKLEESLLAFKAARDRKKDNAFRVQQAMFEEQTAIWRDRMEEAKASGVAMSREEHAEFFAFNDEKTKWKNSPDRYTKTNGYAEINNLQVRVRKLSFLVQSLREGREARAAFNEAREKRFAKYWQGFRDDEVPPELHTPGMRYLYSLTGEREFLARLKSSHNTQPAK